MTPNGPLTTTELSDLYAIERLLSDYAVALNGRDWDHYRALFRDDTVIDYTSAGGICGSLVEVSAWVADAFKAFPISQLYITDKRIELHGLTASCDELVLRDRSEAGGVGRARVAFRRWDLCGRSHQGRGRMAVPKAHRASGLDTRRLPRRAQIGLAWWIRSQAEHGDDRAGLLAQFDAAHVAAGQRPTPPRALRVRPSLGARPPHTVESPQARRQERSKAMASSMVGAGASDLGEIPVANIVGAARCSSPRETCCRRPETRALATTEDMHSFPALSGQRTRELALALETAHTQARGEHQPARIPSRDSRPASPSGGRSSASHVAPPAVNGGSGLRRTDSGADACGAAPRNRTGTACPVCQPVNLRRVGCTPEKHTAKPDRPCAITCIGSRGRIS